MARLAEEYERGAVLAFFFADQLKGVESAGFDLANFFPDMIASFDPARELRRPSEYAETVQRADRRARSATRGAQSAGRSQCERGSSDWSRRGAVKRSRGGRRDAATQGLQRRRSTFEEMLANYPGEPRIFFALGQTASLAAMDATDEQVQAQRLNRALGQYRLAIAASSPETDKAILSRAARIDGTHQRVSRKQRRGAEVL